MGVFIKARGGSAKRCGLEGRHVRRRYGCALEIFPQKIHPGRRGVPGCKDTLTGVSVPASNSMKARSEANTPSHLDTDRSSLSEEGGES